MVKSVEHPFPGAQITMNAFGGVAKDTQEGDNIARTTTVTPPSQ